MSPTRSRRAARRATARGCRPRHRSGSAPSIRRVDRRAGIGGLEQRPVGAALDAAQDQTSRSALSQIETPCARDRAPGSRRCMKAPPPVASTLRAAVEQPLDDAALAVAEIGLAVGLEDLGDGGVRRLLDLGVGVDEGEAEPRRQPAADRRICRRPSCRQARSSGGPDSGARSRPGEPWLSARFP